MSGFRDLLSADHSNPQRSRQWRKLLLPFAGAALLAIPLPALSSEWRQVSEQDALLVLYAPGLPRTPTDTRQKIEGWQIYESSYWNAVGGSWPKAELYLQRYKRFAPSNLVYVRRNTLEENLHSWFKNESVVVGSVGKATNIVGDLEFLNFTREGNVPCIFFLQFADTFADERGYTIGTFEVSQGNIVISGWYCTTPGTDQTDTVFNAFLNGIGLKQFAVPPEPDSPQGSTEDPKIKDSAMGSAFKVYEDLNDDVLSKVFVVGDDNKWGWARRTGYEEALKSAVDECNASGGEKCQLFAVGNAIVRDMDEKAKNQLVSAYRASRSGDSIFSRDIIPGESVEKYKQIEDYDSYKVLFSSADGVYGWSSQSTYEAAVRDAKTTCEQRSGQRKCAQYAVGDNIIWDLSENHRQEIVGKYVPQVSDPEILKLKLGARRGFMRYLSEKVGWGFKAFAAAERGAWAWRQQSSIQATIDDALLSCRAYARGSPCRLFALGDVIVWKMSPEELEKVKRTYAGAN